MTNAAAPEGNPREKRLSTIYQTLSAGIDRRSPAPIYRQITALLERSIENGSLAPGDRLPPERELMGLFGVSRPTLRAALAPLIKRSYLNATQGRGNFVLKPERKRPISLLALERFREEYWSTTPLHYGWLLDGGKTAGAFIHYHYLPTLEDFKEIFRNPPPGCDGLLMFRPNLEWCETIAEIPEEVFEQCPIPIMLIDRPIRKKGMNLVLFDNFEASRRATKKLIELGHTRIGFIGIPHLAFTAYYDGYCAAMDAAAIPIRKEDVLLLKGQVLVGGSSPDHVTLQISDFLRERSYTAVVVALLLPSFEKAVQKLGIALPYELSAIVISDQHVFKISPFRWSGMPAPSAQIAARGVEVLGEICRGLREPGVYEAIPPVEQDGGTCRPPGPAADQ